MAIEAQISTKLMGSGPDSVAVLDGSIYTISADWDADSYTDHIYIHKSTNGGTTWAELTDKDLSSDIPGETIGGGLTLEIASDGTLHIVYLTTNYDIFHRTYDGSWSAQEKILEDGNPAGYDTADYLFMAIDSDDQVHLSVNTSTTGTHYQTCIYLHQSSDVWQTPEVVYECGATEGFLGTNIPIIIGKDDEPFIFIAGNPIDGHSFEVLMFKDDGGWTYEQATPGGDLCLGGFAGYDPQTDDIYLAYMEMVTKYDYINVRRRDGETEVWQTPELVADESSGDNCLLVPVPVIDQSGKLSVLYIWHDTTPGGDVFDKVMFRQKNGSWGSEIEIYATPGVSEVRGEWGLPSTFANSATSQFDGFVCVYSEAVIGSSIDDVWAHSYTEGFTGLPPNPPCPECGEELDDEGVCPDCGWPNWIDKYSLCHTPDNLLYEPTTTVVNSRYRGIRESEKQNQFISDIYYDIARLFYRYESLLQYYTNLIIQRALEEEGYILPTQKTITIVKEGESETNYTYWWPLIDNDRILNWGNVRIEDYF